MAAMAATHQTADTCELGVRAVDTLACSSVARAPVQPATAPRTLEEAIDASEVRVMAFVRSEFDRLRTLALEERKAANALVHMGSRRAQMTEYQP